MKIVVLAGGLSPERDVSLSSGTLIANALIEMGNDVLLLDLFLGDENDLFPLTYVNNSTNVRFSYSVPAHEPDLTALKNKVKQKGLIGKGVIEKCQEADVVFLALHGSIGENGQLQALLDIYGIPYTGSGYAGSLLAMDKDLSKQIMRSKGILTPEWIYMCLKQEYKIEGLKYPCVVKPNSCGSSLGVNIVENSSQMLSALEYAKTFEDYIIIEDKVAGREFSVGVLNNEALPPIEIKPLSGFYDYKNKYQAGLAQEVCPAQISEELTISLKTIALSVHHELRLGYYSRIDFIVDNANQIFCLEANTLPGMTPTSLLPQEANAIGISYNELCERIALCL